MERERIKLSYRPEVRIALLSLLPLVLLPLLILRLWVVQVREGKTYDKKIERQSFRPVRLTPVRGRILASGGEVLVDNECTYDLVFHVSEMRQPGGRTKTTVYLMQQTIRLSRLLDREVAITAADIRSHLMYTPAIPMCIFEDLNQKELCQLSEIYPPIPGLEIRPRIFRHYPYPGVASHVIGFVGQDRPEKTEDMKDYKTAYISFEPTGRAGLEQKNNHLLAGKAGLKLLQVNPLGYAYEEVGEPALPVPGKDLVLTIDLKAQLAAEKMLKQLLVLGRRGALVLVDIKDGAVLAMASVPGYDLSTWKRGSWLELKEKEGNPLLNRAVGGAYIPGSIVKPLIALAALQNQTISPATTYDCRGRYTEHSLSIRCWNRYGHGDLDLLGAIKYSCNPYFINCSIETGLDKIRPILVDAGLGKRPTIDLPGASTGFLPSRESAIKIRGRAHPWGLADTAFLGIGQGMITVTPLQAALYVAAIANGGVVYKPFLVRSVLNPDGSIWSNTAPVVNSRILVAPEFFDVVREGMHNVVAGFRGSGSHAANDFIDLAGKTGTAQVGSRGKMAHNTWFVCFGPYEDPQYAMAFVIEHGVGSVGVSGGRTNAPLVRDFFEYWLGPDAGDAN